MVKGRGDEEFVVVGVFPSTSDAELAAARLRNRAGDASPVISSGMHDHPSGGARS